MEIVENLTIRIERFLVYAKNSKEQINNPFENTVHPLCHGPDELSPSSHSINITISIQALKQIDLLQLWPLLVFTTAMFVVLYIPTKV